MIQAAMLPIVMMPASTKAPHSRTARRRSRRRLVPAMPASAKTDVFDETRDEVGFAAGSVRRQQPVFEMECARELPHDAVDRAAFLRSAGEVDAAHHRLNFELRRLEHRRKKSAEHIPSAPNCCGKA